MSVFPDFHSTGLAFPSDDLSILSQKPDHGRPLTHEPMRPHSGAKPIHRIVDTAPPPKSLLTYTLQTKYKFSDFGTGPSAKRYDQVSEVEPRIFVGNFLARQSRKNNNSFTLLFLAEDVP
jgi:hypothetical protein